MTYKRFEDLPVWGKAIELAAAIYTLTERPEFRGHSSLCDQVERAAVSVSNNIAEGFERGTTAELLSFLYLARGSAGEVRSMLCLMERLPAFSNLKSQISNLKLMSENISRQLRAWADSLQNSDIKGQRHLTAEARRTAETKRSREEFLERLRQVQEAAKPRPEAGEP